MSQAASAWDSPGFLLWHATLRWQRSITAALRPLELTHVQFVLLAGTWWLAGQGLTPSQRELAGHAGADVMMTSQVVRALERRGLVCREPDPVDTRVKRLHVTAAGRDLAEQAIEVVESADRSFFAHVPASAELLLDLLKAMARADGRTATGSGAAPDARARTAG